MTFSIVQFNLSVKFGVAICGAHEMIAKRRGQHTKERILEEACRVFAEKGYRDATHVEICSRAGANPAAVNYYFSSKEELYRAVFSRLTQLADSLYPLGGSLPRDASPEQRLHAFILAILSRLFDPERLDSLHRISMSEMFAPTGILADLLTRRLANDRRHVLGIIGELLGPESTRRDAEWCEMSIVSQCFMAAPRPHHDAPRRLFGLDEAGPAEIARHIFAFSMAGVHAIREQIDARPPAPADGRTGENQIGIP